MRTGLELGDNGEIVAKANEELTEALLKKLHSNGQRAEVNVTDSSIGNPVPTHRTAMISRRAYSLASPVELWWSRPLRHRNIQGAAWR